MKKHKYVCSYCGSDNIIFDTTSRWNIDTQVYDVLDSWSEGCNDCGEANCADIKFFLNDDIKVL
jgi:hypothetical protein